MPGFDGTGPMGQGTGTGRRRGNCQPDDSQRIAGSTEQGSRNFFGGGAFRRGCGAGRRMWESTNVNTQNDEKIKDK